MAIRFLSPIFRQARQGEIHNPAEHQNNYTRQEQPDPLHSHTIGRFLYFPQDYHRGKSACHSEANPKLSLVDNFPSKREMGRVSDPVILRFPGGCDLRGPGDLYGVTAYGGTGNFLWRVFFARHADCRSTMIAVDAL